MVTFSFDDDSHVQRKVHSMDSIPTHNANGLTSNIPKEQLVATILDDFFRIFLCQWSFVKFIQILTWISPAK